jgi:electron transfer flavoprotein alpha subunit
LLGFRLAAHAHQRRAISLDPNCGWARGKADVLYVADALQVIAKANERLRNPISG